MSIAFQYMMVSARRTYVFLVLLPLLMSSGCASYVQNRLRDSTDFVNVGVCTDTVGAGVRLGPWVGAGLGACGKRDGAPGWSLGLFPRSTTLQGSSGVIGVYPLAGAMMGNYERSHALKSSGYFAATDGPEQLDIRILFARADDLSLGVSGGGYEQSHGPLAGTSGSHLFGTPGARAGEIQVYAGFLAGLYASLDVVEILDFVGGFFGLDICNDD